VTGAEARDAHDLVERAGSSLDRGDDRSCAGVVRNTLGDRLTYEPECREDVVRMRGGCRTLAQQGVGAGAQRTGYLTPCLLCSSRYPSAATDMERWLFKGQAGSPPRVIGR
jgi:hypothetical protein